MSAHQPEPSGDILDIIIPSAKSQGEPDMITSNSMYLHVSPALVSTIIQNKYVSLSELLPSHSQDVTLGVTAGGHVTLNKHSKSVQITSFDQWISAFLVFSAIYTEQFQDTANSLFTYIALVQELYKTYGITTATKYDEKFRRLKERSPSTTKWDDINQELYLLSASQSFQMAANSTKPPAANSAKPPNSSFRAKRPRFSQQTRPRGFCHLYTDSGSCNRADCPYKHQCFKCHGTHGGALCKTATVSKPASQSSPSRVK